MKLDDAYKHYITQITVNEGKAKATINSYKRDISTYLEYLSEKKIKNIDSIKQNDVEEYIQQLSKTRKGTSVARIAASIRSFHQFLSFLYDKEDPSQNLEINRGVKSLPVYATIDEINRLLDSFDDTDPEQLLDHAVLLFIYSCGLRVTEAVSLTINRVDLSAGIVRILGKGNKERIVPIPEGAIKILKNYYLTVRPVFVKRKSNYFFINKYGRKLTRESVEKLMRSKCEELGINKHLTPHKLRHSYATHLLQGGADLRSIQEMLGHSDVSTTEIYTHVANEQLRNTYDKFNPDTDEELIILTKKK